MQLYLWDAAKAVLGGKFIMIQEPTSRNKKKISNKQPNFTTKGIRESRTNKAQS